MKTVCIVATHGDPAWQKLALDRALPSAQGQGFAEIVAVHDSTATLAEVRNAAAYSVSADVLVFLDADDELAPGYLEAMQPWMTPSAVLTMTGDAAYRWPPQAVEPGDWYLLVPAVEYLFDDGTTVGPEIPNRGGWPRVNEAVIGTAILADKFREMGGFRELVSNEDYDLWLRCYDAGARFAYCEQAVYRAHVSILGRNNDQSSYRQIWADHLARVGG